MITFKQDTSVVLGYVPIRRDSFPVPTAATLRDAIKKAVFPIFESIDDLVIVDIDDIVDDGMLWSHKDVGRVVDKLRAARVDAVFFPHCNFGQEEVVTMVARELGKPVLLWGPRDPDPEESGGNTIVGPRAWDTQCGLFATGRALSRNRVPFTYIENCWLDAPILKRGIDDFVRVASVVKAFRGMRVAQIGTRPDCFWTCRYNEKKLQKLGPTAVVCDLSEAFAEAKAIGDDDPEYRKHLDETKRYADCSQCDPQAIQRSAKFELFLRRFQKRHRIDGFGVQCWASIQHNYGCSACLAMSRLGNDGIPCACEADILGTMSMHAALLAAGTPAGLADWNNLHNDDDELATIWHCGVFPGVFSKPSGSQCSQPPIRIGDLGVQDAPPGNTHGTVHFVSKPGPVTLFRVAQDVDSNWHAVVVEAAFEDNAAETSGCYGWCRIPNLQSLYRNVLLQHFPHHVGVVQEHYGNVLWEAFGNYFDMKMYHSAQVVPGLYTSQLPF